MDMFVIYLLILGQNIYSIAVRSNYCLKNVMAMFCLKSAISLNNPFILRFDLDFVLP